MTCERCEDIHLAQRSGLTLNPCRCDCHIFVSSNTEPTITFQNSPYPIFDAEPVGNVLEVFP